jgi:hypothetical protein
MEAIQMDGKMMELRFADMQSKENNIYTMFIQEKEKN